jgi:hypothetical protein
MKTHKIVAPLSPKGLNAYESHQKEFLKLIFDMDEIFDFCAENKVEIILGSGALQLCFINRGEWGAPYAADANPLVALVLGITRYKSIENETEANNH